ncbi:hypothetical protein [Holdemanella biformis]|uniref:hypothetical protein n=1 Tax=Holdemanella biformis TaxID=1735 RepID=UPI0022E05903|nr:hypothetical protein [Holdemanella biformis]
MDERIYQIVEQIVEIHQKAYEFYLPLVEDVCSSICIYIPVVLRVILTHIGKCGKRKIVIQQIFLKRKENKVFQIL